MRADTSAPESSVAVALALGLYALWTAATYLLEGRVDLLARPPGGGRVVYALVANIAVGVMGTAWLLSWRVERGQERPRRFGFRAAGRTLVAAAVAGALGLAALWALGGPGVEADLLFAAYHFAHSAPFNQPEMVLRLLAPGLVTSLVFFLGRDVYATILVQNALGTIGVGQSVEPHASAGRMPGLIAPAALATALVVMTHVGLRRRARGAG